MRTRLLRSTRFLVSLLLIIALVGCKTDLNSGLTEQDANEMMTILQDAKVDVEKLAGAKGTVTLRVETKDVGKAVAVLKKNGYPKDNFQSLGDVFKKDGLLSTPLEEKARYLFAVSQQLSETLSNLDGVLKARVHVVLPTIDDVTKETMNHASASVFIKHYKDVELKEYIPKIKLLVNNSIPSLEYDRITVLLFPSAGYQTIGKYRSDLKNIYDPEHTSKKERISSFVKYVLYSLVVIIIFNIGVLMFNRMSGNKQAPKISGLFKKDKGPSKPQKTSPNQTAESEETVANSDGT